MFSPLRQSNSNGPSKGLHDIVVSPYDCVQGRQLTEVWGLVLSAKISARTPDPLDVLGLAFAIMEIPPP